MSTKLSNQEIVHEGWLTKSPPSKRVWRARWRRRWFVLRHSGELPDQYFLCYYTDRTCKTLKGQIDLDQCEQVDAGLHFEDRKQKYAFMFDVRTPSRTYYLAAETEADMNKWVQCVCQVCGLKAYNQDDNLCDFPPGESENGAYQDAQNLESPPLSPSSTASGPYIPISECTSGTPFHSYHNLSECYDCPRKLNLPSNLDLRGSGSNSPPLQSPLTDGESVFTDEDCVSLNSKPVVNWETFPNPLDGSLEDVKPIASGSWHYRKPLPPPRPPKPQNLLVLESRRSHTYCNLEEINKKRHSRSAEHLDEMYDFPRSHVLNGQSNLNPDVCPKSIGSLQTVNSEAYKEVVFRYDFSSLSSVDVSLYDNGPQSTKHAPFVDRGLKPGRKGSDSASNEPSPVPSGFPPSIDRSLKPSSVTSDIEDIPIKLCPPPLSRSGNQYTYRAAPSPIPRTSDASDQDVKEENDKCHHEDYYSSFSPKRSFKKPEIQYLDLDLDPSDQNSPSTPPAVQTSAPKSPLATTIYKTVDFLKTEAFNRTRQKVEEERNKCSEVTH